jgi:hypothetical protein
MGSVDRVAKQTVPKVRVEGPKWMMDGTPIEQNSLQRVDYVDRPGWRGRSNFTDEQLREILQLALTRSTQLALHVVGDAETVDIAPLHITHRVPTLLWDSLLSSLNASGSALTSVMLFSCSRASCRVRLVSRHVRPLIR